MNTAWQQLEAAALTLARSGPIKDRLADAYRNHLSLVHAEDLPEGLRAEFCACHAALTREAPLRGEDARADAAEHSELVANGAAAGAARAMLKSVPQVISLRVAEG